MTYAIVAYVLSLILWLTYLAWLGVRLKRASADRPAGKP
jgi:hypothetical protein